MPTTPSPTELRAQWTALRKQQPALRIREAALQLGVSEAELLATGCGLLSSGVVRLQGDWKALLTQFKAVGQMMALTRNEHAVIERDGLYTPCDFAGHVGLVLGDIDLRIFWGHWVHGFAVTDAGPDRTLRSFQFFDASGAAVHKAYLRPSADEDRFEALVREYRAEDQSPRLAIEPAPTPPEPKPDAEVDLAAFQSDWRTLQDTHDFYLLLHKHGLTRTQALRLAEAELAWRLEPAAFRQTLERAAAEKLPIMVFVPSRGCWEIYTGPVVTLRESGTWFNVLDPAFNLHVRADQIAEAWVVRKPTTDGIVTSLECYAADGASIVYLFGQRKPGNPERAEWRALIDALPRLAALPA